ncbi:MAG: asparagine synthase (glutamine-hydrolyzing) [Roseburia sp.]
MCGFAGFVDRNENKQKILKGMLHTIEHRGPDSEGTYIDENAALGFRRLSIIDLADGSQPLYNEDRSLVLMFNGEIYNYQELREELIADGHIFTTKTDSEVLLHGYEKYGEKLLDKLRGMFAFCIWDVNRKKLFIARDFFGIKPMYYAKMGDTFLFGSETKAFLAHPDFKKELNEDMLEHYLSFQFVPGNNTLFRDVYALPPAHFLTYENGKVQVTRYWQPEFTPDESKSYEECVDEIAKVMQDSVSFHKIADVEVGSYLSSGVDSSFLACMSRVDKTFTVGFDNNGYNEISYAKELSEEIGITNHSKVITPEEYWDAFGTIQYHMDMPVADPSIVPLYFLAKEASKYVKVVFSGEGADELFGGYNIYREPLEYTGFNKIPLCIRKVLGKLAECFPDVKGSGFLIRHSKSLEERYIGNASIFGQREKKKVLKAPLKSSAMELTAPVYEQMKDKDPVNKMQYIDLNFWLVGDILQKADKMGMANSLEIRVPYLDKEVMKVAASLPLSARVSGETTKCAFREAALRVLPERTAKKKKLGFPTPIKVWLQEDKYYNIVKEKFNSDAAKKYFNTDYLNKILEKARRNKGNYSRRVWTVYTFLVWYEEYFIKR